MADSGDETGPRSLRNPIWQRFCKRLFAWLAFLLSGVAVKG